MYTTFNDDLKINVVLIYEIKNFTLTNYSFHTITNAPFKIVKHNDHLYLSNEWGAVPSKHHDSTNEKKKSLGGFIWIFGHYKRERAMLNFSRASHKGPNRALPYISSSPKIVLSAPPPSLDPLPHSRSPLPRLRRWQMLT